MEKDYTYAATNVPNTAALDKAAEMSGLTYGNMTSAQDTAALRDEDEERAAKKFPNASDYTQTLQIYHCGERRKNNESEVHDAYDRYRQYVNIGFRLDDPAQDIASAYYFTENGETLFFGHFNEDKPVNNSQGFQAVYFDAKGDILKFAVVNANGDVKSYKPNEEFPPSVVQVCENVKSVTAPTRTLVLENLVAVNESLAVKLKDRHTAELV